MTPTAYWLVAGVALILAELHFAIGLFFLGLGAIAAGAAVHFGFVEDTAVLTQFLVFFISTAVFAAVLWKPLQKFRRPAPGYNDIIGGIAFVGSGGLSRGKGGEVTWSGTIMKAQFAPGVTAESLEAGSQVTIVEVKGATLIVTPKA